MCVPVYVFEMNYALQQKNSHMYVALYSWLGRMYVRSITDQSCLYMCRFLAL